MEILDGPSGYVQMESHSVTQAGVQWHDLSLLQPPQVQEILMPQPPSIWVNRLLPPRLANFILVFVFLVETGFHLVGNSGLELLTT
ncbi:UPF0764 protein C16orf89, partial [Plecturocebus cupreus]